MQEFPPLLILAGGLGTRLAGMHPGVPKSLVPVNGEPFIAHQLRLLRKQGVNDIVLCIAHRGQSLAEYVGDGSKFGVKVRYALDGDALLGTGGAVAKACQLTDFYFAVMYGDSYLDVEFAPIYKQFLKAGRQALLTVYRNDNCIIPSNLLVEDGAIAAYNKDNPTSQMAHVDFGLTIFSKSVFEKPRPMPFDLSVVIQDLIAKKQLAAYETEKRFYEVGTPVGIAQLEDYLQSRSPGAG